MPGLRSGGQHLACEEAGQGEGPEEHGGEVGTEDQGMFLTGTEWSPDADSRDPEGQRVGDKRGWRQEETPLERARAGTQTVQGSEELFGLPPTL